jgi:hypothetical protein
MLIFFNFKRVDPRRRKIIRPFCVRPALLVKNEDSFLCLFEKKRGVMNFVADREALDV